MILKDAKARTGELTRIFNGIDVRTKGEVYELIRLADGSENRYGKSGCCLTCSPEKKEEHKLEDSENCLCYDCKCRKCDWYEFHQRKCARFDYADGAVKK